MILLGTSIGRVFGFNPTKKTIDIRSGEPRSNNLVTSLSFLNSNEDYFVFTTKSGQFQKNNLYDAFDFHSFQFENKTLTSGDVSDYHSKVFVSDTSGAILSHDFSFENETQ